MEETESTVIFTVRDTLSKSVSGRGARVERVCDSLIACLGRQ